MNLVELARRTDDQEIRGVARTARSFQLNSAPPRRIDTLEREPQALEWTKTADRIVGSIASYCNRNQRLTTLDGVFSTDCVAFFRASDYLV